MSTRRRASILSLNSTSATEDLADVERVLAGEPAALRHCAPLADAARQHGLALLPRSRRAEELAQKPLSELGVLGSVASRIQLLHLALCPGGQRFRSELKRFPTVNLPLEAAPEPPDPHAAPCAGGKVESGSGAARGLACPYAIASGDFVLFHEMDLAAAARTMRLPEGT